MCARMSVSETAKASEGPTSAGGRGAGPSTANAAEAAAPSASTGPKPAQLPSASEDSESDVSDGGWMSWFCNLQGHDFFAELEEDYIRDNFNLYGLKARISDFDAALAMILGDAPSGEDLCCQGFVELYRNAMDLFGLIHARYIMAPRGLQQMKEKYLQGRFGHCPRVHCDRQSVLPVGLSEEVQAHRVRTYCPRCQEVYDLRQSDANDIDGAFFGPSFPHIFLQTFSNLVPLDPPEPYRPKVFGFRVHNTKSTILTKLENGEYGDSQIPASQRRARGPGSFSGAAPGSGEVDDVDMRTVAAADSATVATTAPSPSAATAGSASSAAPSASQSARVGAAA
eukprot:GHVT01024522.1.p1 GENE.GHVT01024522.1~~GHVT01024522.1.p1  ORF type:complete len:340 (+),score=75.82 GHVT01024522.1:423-1442(+)